ncbi:hypothetical protein MTO96_013665 [Rhipicephalus appendiculatus]
MSAPLEEISSINDQLRNVDSECGAYDARKGPMELAGKCTYAALSAECAEKRSTTNSGLVARYLGLVVRALLLLLYEGGRIVLS